MVGIFRLSHTHETGVVDVLRLEGVPDAGLQVLVRGIVLGDRIVRRHSALGVDEPVMTVPRRAGITVLFERRVLAADGQLADEPCHKGGVLVHHVFPFVVQVALARRTRKVVDIGLRRDSLVELIDVLQLHLEDDSALNVLVLVPVDCSGLFGEGVVQLDVPLVVIRVRHDAPLVQTEVDELGDERRVAEKIGQTQIAGLEGMGALDAHEVRQRRAVVDPGQRRDGGDPSAVSAFEQRRQLGIRCDGAFLFRTVCHELRQQTGGRGAERMADEVDFGVVPGLTPVLQDPRIRAAVAGVAVAGAVCFAVVHGNGGCHHHDNDSCGCH